VTGSSGFVGKALIERLLNNDIEVIVADIENGVDLSNEKING